MVMAKMYAILSRAKRVIFLGYSLPAADIHAQFILRVGLITR